MSILLPRAFVLPALTLRKGHHLTVQRAAASNSKLGGIDGYLSLAGAHTSETEVKKSRFLAKGWPVTSASQALQLVEKARDPAASHNCFAYKLGDEYRSSDDGEPGGTAGRPILGSIEREGLDGVCVLVTRYFGGTKLGAGGLVRAYAGAARECLRQAPKIQVKRLVDVCIKAPFQAIGTVYSFLEEHKGERLSEEYAESGEVLLKLRLQQSAVDEFNSDLVNATAGQICVQPISL